MNVEEGGAHEPDDRPRTLRAVGERRWGRRAGDELPRAALCPSEGVTPVDHGVRVGGVGRLPFLVVGVRGILTADGGT